MWLFWLAAMAINLIRRKKIWTKAYFLLSCNMHYEEVSKKIRDVFMPLYPPVQCKDIITEKKERHVHPAILCGLYVEAVIKISWVLFLWKCWAELQTSNMYLSHCMWKCSLLATGDLFCVSDTAPNFIRRWEIRKRLWWTFFQHFFKSCF